MASSRFTWGNLGKISLNHGKGLGHGVTRGRAFTQHAHSPGVYLFLVLYTKTEDLEERLKEISPRTSSFIMLLCFLPGAFLGNTRPVVISAMYLSELGISR